MAVKKGQEIELTVEALAFGGKGIARINGLTVFVDQAIPGDRVFARIYKRKKNYAEARVLKRIISSKDRVPPRCVYSGFCGGCKLQFLDYAKQLDYKQRHVAETIAHIGMQKDIYVHPTIASTRIFEYRNKMEFTCSDRRWLLPEEMEQGLNDTGIAVGLHVPGTYYKVLDTKACLLQPDLGNTILEHVRDYIRNSGYPIYGLRSHVGFWRFVMLRHSFARDQWMVNLVTAAEDRREVQPLSDSLQKNFPTISSVVNNITAKKAGVAMGEYEILLAGESNIIDSIDSFEFEISANSFFQTNTHSATLLYQVVKSFADLSGSEKVVDLYCGTGTIAIYLADEAESVFGIEMIPSAVADAKRNCQRNQIPNCHFICADVKQGLTTLNVKPDVMIIDPPRVGMHKEVVEQVLTLAPKKIVYVSCNPATLARDIVLLKDSYKVLEIQPVDMFPHTFHIEAVANLERA
ncbi:MAG: 23S rRNA (uracil(1939)-C(5))-methyltransferase RlmD [Desulfobacteraceae bacterium]|jgi:23S rRNA (uracil1939-C5)-methyltransferase